MPGLFGLLHLEDRDPPAADATSSLLAEMAHRMSHTGAEMVDTWIDPVAGLAIARIAQPHLRPMKWPAQNAPRRDTPVAFVDGVLHGDAAELASRLDRFERLGRSQLRALSGFFSAARWEPAHRRLTLAVDRRASRPLFYTVVRNTLYFAPEVKALLAVPGVDKTLDSGAIGVFLGAGYVLAHQSLFASIHRLAGGEILVASPAEPPHVETYWRYRLSSRGDGTPPGELAAELDHVVRGAVERNVGDVDRTIVFLSGGVDSRAIAIAAEDAARRQGQRLRTVTWGTAGERPESDLVIAVRVAEALGTRHRILHRSVAGYGGALTAVNYVVDGLTDVAAYHPHEYSLMRTLAGSGARSVLRGDECFGWMGHVSSLEQALLTLNLRKLRHLRLFDRIVQPDAYARWCDASDAALDAAVRPLRGQDPDDAKDELYFRHRLQGYLGGAAYYKHVILDHRAPLLDEAILDFNARVPARLRHDKQLFLRAAERAAPDLWRIPLATAGNLEDWGELLATPSTVREHVERELLDTQSGFWELVDRAALLDALPRLGHPPGRARRDALRGGARTIAKAALSIAPPVKRALMARSHRAAIRVDQVCLRLLALKSWHDLFVTGDGSRRALEARLARTEPRAA